MKKTKIIAELCQNHLGDTALLKKMVEQCASSGVDFCKIQSMRVKDLTFRERFEFGEEKNGKTVTIKRPYGHEYSRLSPLDLSDDDHKYFIDLCRENNVLPLTTVFTRNRIDFLSQLDWGHDKIKIASFDCRSKPMLKDLAEAGFKHLIISTGSTFDHEIEDTVDFLNDLGVNYSLLHCVSIYPTPITAGHINRIDYLRKKSKSVGFSEHSNYEIDGLKLAKVALTKNIEWIERHFTSVGKDKSRDGPVSLNYDQMKELVDLTKLSPEELQKNINKTMSIDAKNTILGQEKRKLSELELLNRDYYHGRFASKFGERIVYNWEDYEK